MSRAALLLEALEVVEKATFADEALFAEASKYVDSPSFFVGGRDLSSFTPSGFGLAMAKGGVSWRVGLCGWKGAKPVEYYFG